MLFAGDPFAAAVGVHTNGQGLNPQLQNLAMVFHPPLLFLGYAGYTAPFAYLIAGLCTRGGRGNTESTEGAETTKKNRKGAEGVDHRSQITDHRSQITDHRSQITDFRFQISDHRSQITDFRFQITDHRFQISDHRFQITNLSGFFWRGRGWFILGLC
jgi:hypothetical protein